MPARSTAASSGGSTGITVVLADDHRILRDGLRYLLETNRDIKVVASVGDGGEAVREVERLSPDVVVMDISMPGVNGIEATREIIKKKPDIGVVVLSIHSSPMMVRQALDAGAGGYVIKESGVDDVVTAVRAVAAGKRFLSAGLAQDLLDSYRGRDRKAGKLAAENLTASECEILRLVANGKSNAEVAAVLGLSRRTVETYRSRLMRKLDIDDLPTLVKFAIRQGLIPLE